MAQFIHFAPGVEVNGETVLSVINALNMGQDFRREVLKRNGINDPQPGQWYSQESWLKGFREIASKLGDNTLYRIGTAIPENAQFPPDVDNLEKALAIIDVAYNMNHRNGEIGYYKLLSFNAQERKAVMECKNPYPSEFDRGIITTMLRKFKPADSMKYEVILDTTKETRQKGGDSCTYLVTW